MGKLQEVVEGTALHRLLINMAIFIVIIMIDVFLYTGLPSLERVVVFPFHGMQENINLDSIPNRSSYGT